MHGTSPRRRSRQTVRTGEIMATVLGSLGGLAWIGAMVKSMFERPKTRADAIRAINEAAAVNVNISASQVVALSNRLSRIERKYDQLLDHTHSVDSWWHNIHTPWDGRLVEVVQGKRSPDDLGVLVPPPPPIFEEIRDDD